MRCESIMPCIRVLTWWTVHTTVQQDNKLTNGATISESTPPLVSNMTSARSYYTQRLLARLSLPLLRGQPQESVKIMPLRHGRSLEADRYSLDCSRIFEIKYF